MGDFDPEDISLAPFRKALGPTKLLAAGGFGPENFAEGIDKGEHDLVAMGRYFMYVDVLVGMKARRSWLTRSANHDLIERLRSGEPMYKWDRSRFYGPFRDNEVGYTVHPDRTLAKSGDIARAQLAD